ncbi:MAG: NAD(P)-dependent oxidoreductase [Chloroflexi bacterium]|nr:NAD(P)-dependent oxidoreductase [Chloroflexota bacterium]MDA1226698.1 NAD(P)-dependent oxidoreductase [Chloroflexota bacterium]
MKVLIADGFSEGARSDLKDSGFEVIYEPDVRDDALEKILHDTGSDVLVVRSTRVTEAMLRASRLGLVIRSGAGYNTIDVATATELGIKVANCPGMNANAVVELAFGLIIALDRHIPENVHDLRQGKWNKINYSSARGLSGSTLGLVGLGTIGQGMIPRARAFGMSVVGWSRSLTPERAEALGIEMKSSPVEVAAASDVVSIHVALTSDTRNLADEAFFQKMRDGAFFINTSRAEVVDESALANAVKTRGIRAGLDIFEGEPATGTGEVDNPLFQLDGVIGTHHIGGQTSEAQRSIAEETVRIIQEFRDTGVAPNQVN